MQTQEIETKPALNLNVVTISVTENDIINGKSKDGCECPVALAMRRAGFDEMMVGPTYFYPNGVTEPGAHAAPEVVRFFVDDFDAGRLVAPFSFEYRQ